MRKSRSGCPVGSVEPRKSLAADGIGPAWRDAKPPDPILVWVLSALTGQDWLGRSLRPVAFPSPVPDLTGTSQLPVVEQMAAHFRDGIRDGTYPVGERLPTIREVAERAGVTRNAVQLAYRQLAAEGLV